jgi:CheY-like chemotaxis protein
MSEGSERNILIVDDEPAIRRLLCAAIKAQGYSVFEADCGASALQIAAEQAPFALVVSDMVMPGMDGIALANRLASNGHAEAFLFISGYCDYESMEHRMNGLPSATYLPKPFLVTEFLRVFSELLGAPPDGPRSASVRDRNGRPALSRSEDDCQQLLRLRRKSERLLEEAACLVAATRRSIGAQKSLRREIRRRSAALRRIEHLVALRLTD